MSKPDATVQVWIVELEGIRVGFGVDRQEAEQDCSALLEEGHAATIHSLVMPQSVWLRESGQSLACATGVLTRRCADSEGTDAPKSV